MVSLTRDQSRWRRQGIFLLLGFVFLFGVMALIAALARQPLSAFDFGLTAICLVLGGALALLIRPSTDPGWRGATYKFDTPAKRAAGLALMGVSLIIIFLLVAREAGLTTAIIEVVALVAMLAVAVLLRLRRRPQTSDPLKQ